MFESTVLILSPSLHQMDNALVQIAGTKRIILFPPSDADCLYLKGDKSQVLDIDDPDMARYPLFKNAHPFECTLEPGSSQLFLALIFVCFESVSVKSRQDFDQLNMCA